MPALMTERGMFWLLAILAHECLLTYIVSLDCKPIDTDISCNQAVLGQVDELRSACLNLVTNAVRYTPDGGKIEISWRYDPKEESAIFAVQDNGIGIDAEDIPRLTERFYRVDKSRSREKGGTGLGLAIVKHVAIRNHCRLDIQSEPGKGSTFSLIFPKDSLIE